MMKIAIQMGTKNDRTKIPIKVAQVKVPGIISRNLCTRHSFGFLVLGLGKLNIFLVIYHHQARNSNKYSCLHKKRGKKKDISSQSLFFLVKNIGQNGVGKQEQIRYNRKEIGLPPVSDNIHSKINIVMENYREVNGADIKNKDCPAGQIQKDCHDQDPLHQRTFKKFLAKKTRDFLSWV